MQFKIKELKVLLFTSHIFQEVKPQEGIFFMILKGPHLLVSLAKQQELKSLSIHACQDLMDSKYSNDLSMTNNLSAADLREIEAN